MAKIGETTELCPFLEADHLRGIYLLYTPPKISLVAFVLPAVVRCFPSEDPCIWGVTQIFWKFSLRIHELFPNSLPLSCYLSSAMGFSLSLHCPGKRIAAFAVTSHWKTVPQLWAHSNWRSRIVRQLCEFHSRLSLTEKIIATITVALNLEGLEQFLESLSIRRVKQSNPSRQRTDECHWCWVQGYLPLLHFTVSAASKGMNKSSPWLWGKPACDFLAQNYQFFIPCMLHAT